MSKMHMVTSLKEVKQLIGYCKQTKYCSFDFETMGLEYYEPHRKPLTVQISFQPGSAWVIPLYHKESVFRKNNKWKKVLRLFGREVLEDWDISKIAWNFKFEYKWCLRFGITCKGRLFDAQLAKYCLDEEIPNDLKSWVDRLLPQYSGYEDTIKKGKLAQVKWEDKPLKELADYGGKDADLTLRLFIYFERKLIKLGFYNLFRNLLMMGMRVLAESEAEGMVIDRDYLVKLVDEYKIKLQKAQDKLDNMPALAKFNKIRKKRVLRSLIENVELEIEKLRKKDAQKNARLISNREAKIKGYMEGKFNKKELELQEPLNWKSPAQVTDFFYGPTTYTYLDPKRKGSKKVGQEFTVGSKIGLKMKPKMFTDTGAPSTSEEALELVKNQDKTGVIDALLDYRGIEHLNKIYVQGMYNILGSDDRVHANYKIFGTVTGRLSCEAPNMQNIPRGTTAAEIKRMFVCPPGYMYLEVDYSQAELRVVAELAKDKAMIDIFRRNYNIHVATACLINGGIHLYDEVKGILKDEAHPKWLFWEKQKKRAKTINFGILYQQGAPKLAAELECSVKEAEEFIKVWFKAYPEVKKWIDNQKKFAHNKGYVVSLFGRKRRLYNIYSERYGVMLEAERQAVNTPIQGTASDFGLLSQIVIRELKLRGVMPKDMPQVVTVHDSIGFYIRPDVVHQMVPMIVKICDNPNTLEYFGFKMEHVTMKVAVEASTTNWFDKHDYDAWKNYAKVVQERDAKIAA